jgi:hypothetical protein
VFIFFVWISKQTAVISLISERELVYCAVRTGCLNAFPFMFKVVKFDVKGLSLNGNSDFVGWTLFNSE